MTAYEAHCLCMGDEIERGGRRGQVAAKNEHDLTVRWQDDTVEVVDYLDAHNLRKIWDY